jgi:hypothetical protein
LEIIRILDDYVGLNVKYGMHHALLQVVVFVTSLVALTLVVSKAWPGGFCSIKVNRLAEAKITLSTAKTLRNTE